MYRRIVQILKSRGVENGVVRRKAIEDEL